MDLVRRGPGELDGGDRLSACATGRGSAPSTGGGKGAPLSAVGSPQSAAGRTREGDDAAERRLVARFLRSRDEAAFRHLYRLHSPLLYRVILRTLGRPELAEDALQETWIRAVLGLPRFRWQSAFATWLTGIAIRCCHEARRAQRPAGAEASPTAAAAAPGTALRLDLERAVAELPPGRREVLLLHDVEGFTHAEIAALLDLDEGTSRSQLSRARQQLRRRLAADGGAPQTTEVPTDAGT
ncbi:MAG TPA: sigma-70 family RNA polymerase sigma factor [Thermoanaerobaculia bacterium]|nr:sigma-70 family RNA polymerase sigma factor [Thermoanaerobaculia bacterium]